MVIPICKIEHIGNYACHNTNRHTKITLANRCLLIGTTLDQTHLEYTFPLCSALHRE